MLLVNSASTTVHLIFREISSWRETDFGPNRPLLGAVTHEEQAVEIEFAEPDAGIHWQTFDLVDGLLPESQHCVWVVVAGGVWAEDAREDPAPQAVFSSREAAHAWIHRHTDPDNKFLVWVVSVDSVDLSAPPWEDDTPSIG